MKTRDLVSLGWMGLFILGLSSSVWAEIVTDVQSEDTIQSSSLDSKKKIRKLFAGKSYYYADIMNAHKAIIGIAKFDDSMQTLRYRQILGGKRKDDLEIELRRKGFLIKGKKNRYVKVTKKTKRFIETNYKKYSRFYKTKKAVQRYLDSLGYDVYPPKIELYGANPMNVEQYHPYIDPGAVAIDNIDGQIPLSSKGDVDTAKLGDYTVTYYAKDHAGNLAIKRRRVHVIPTSDVVHRVSSVSEFRQELEDSVLNGVNDIILLKQGIYKITEDGFGTFKFTDEDETNLTIAAEPGLKRGEVVFSGDNSDRVFYIKTEGGVYFRDVTIEEARLVGDYKVGGAIYADSDLVILDNVHLRNNYADYGGGGIYQEFNPSSREICLGRTDSCGLKVFNSLIENNTVRADGGGINASNIYMEKSTLRNNIANYGGAIYGDAVIHKSAFLSNTAHRLGGAIHTHGQNTLAVMSEFIDNNGTGSVCAGSINFDKCKVMENNGSAIGRDKHANRYVMTATNSVFYHNSSSPAAGDWLYLFNNTFINNGSGVYAARFATIINNVFESNTSDYDMNVDVSEKGYVFNNYIDYKKIIENGNVIKKSNLQPDYAGPINFRKGFIPTKDSPTVDKGMIIDEEVLEKYTGYYIDITRERENLKFDFHNRERNDGIPDIGAIELSRKL